MARDKEAPRGGEQAVWDINRTLGSLQTSVESLSKQTKEHDDKIDKLSHKVYAATAVIAVLWAIAVALLGYFHK
jgi:peptidoglycan hydrolase CwlO-like protein